MGVAHLGFVLHTWIRDTQGCMVTTVPLWVVRNVILRFSAVFHKSKGNAGRNKERTGEARNTHRLQDCCRLGKH